MHSQFQNGNIENQKFCL